MIDGLNDTFLVLNADVLTDLDYRELVRHHQMRGGAATIGAYERQVKIDLGVIIKDGDGRIKDYLEKPTSSHLVSMGVYVFEPRILEFIQGSGYLDFPDLVKRLLRIGQTVNYYRFDGYWLDIGRHEDYVKANEEFAKLKDKLVGLSN
jgi:NDP-sugar pyrophosphorylase family protein